MIKAVVSCSGSPPAGLSCRGALYRHRVLDSSSQLAVLASLQRVLPPLGLLLALLLRLFPHRPPRGTQRVGLDSAEMRPPFLNALLFASLDHQRERDVVASHSYDLAIPGAEAEVHDLKEGW